MPNLSTHALLGGTASCLVYLGFCHFTNRKASLLGLTGAALLGAVVASVPDRLEPAVHPNHRGFFHSVAALGLSAYIGFSSLDDHASSQQKKLVQLLASSAYMSHLILDGLTPKSLPVI